MIIQKYELNNLNMSNFVKCNMPKSKNSSSNCVPSSSSLLVRQVTDEIVQHRPLWSQPVIERKFVKIPRKRANWHMRRSDMVHFGVYK